MELTVLDLASCVIVSIVVGALLWKTQIKDEVMTIVVEEKKHITNEDLLAVHNKPARVTEYVKKCANRNREILVGDYIKYCVNCGETIQVA